MKTSELKKHRLDYTESMSTIVEREALHSIHRGKRIYSTWLLDRNNNETWNYGFKVKWESFSITFKTLAEAQENIDIYHRMRGQET